MYTYVKNSSQFDKFKVAKFLFKIYLCEKYRKCMFENLQNMKNFVRLPNSFIENINFNYNALTS
jgi:hypothetical protein